MNALGEPRSVLVLGGSSDIAVATVHRLVTRGAARVVLAGRNPAALENARTRVGPGSQVDTLAFDADKTDSHEGFFDEAFGHGDIDLVILAFGVLPDQREVEEHPSVAVSAAHTNFTGAVSASLHVARRFRMQGHGALVVLSSVAGERARRSNFVYGATKAGLDALGQGLGDALHGSGSTVLVVRPGFVRTKMTAGRHVPPFSTTPEAVADVILRGLARNKEVVWAPPALRWLMMVLRHLPRRVFRRVPL